MSRRNRARRPSGAQLNKAVAIRPAATFSVDQIQALAAAGLVGPQARAQDALPRDPRWATVPFAPGTPLFPQGINVPQQGQRQAEPRQWEIPVSWNLPGFSDRLIPWAILRNAADIPLFRQCIETRKAEAVTKPWDVRLSKNAIRRAQQADPTANMNDIKKALQAKVDPHIGRLIDFWSEPDRWNGRDFTAWATLALEEILVLDALAIYPRRTKGGDLYGFEIIDGTTIKPLLDDFGRRPLPPNPAFQQILYGFPRGEYVSDIDLDPEMPGQQPDPGAYTADQLVYHVTHGRTFTPYGHSSVERALQDGDLWMRRHGWLKAEYTDGVMPSGWLEAGEGQAEWTPQQLEVFEKAFNDYYAGATPSRQRFRILPWGMKPSKSEDLGEKYKPDYDLFLLKLVVRHFDTNINELGFTEARGLGSAGMHEAQERNQDRAATQPTLDRLAKLMTRLQIRFLDAPPEVEFVFPGDEAEDEAKEDEIWNQRVATGRATRNEDRDRTGMPRFEFPEADMPAIETGTGLLFVEGASAAVAPGQVFTGGQPPGLGLPGEPPPGQPGEGGPGAPPPTGGPAGGPGSVPPKPPTPGPAGTTPPGGLTKADLDWLDGQMALTRPGATGTELAKAELDTGLVKSEVAAFRKWQRNARTGRTRGATFAFLHARPADLLAAGIDPTSAPVQYLGKADEPTDPTTPAPPNRDWPGWQVDLAAAAAGGTALLAAIAGTGLASAISSRLAALGSDADAAAVRHMLDELGVSAKIQNAIAPVIKGLHSSGAAIGDASARNLVDGTPMPVTPKDWSAAARLLTADEGGTGPGLRQMLADAGITIKSIADNQVEELAGLLARGLAAHQTPGQMADAIRNLGVSEDRAQMIAHTELARAMGQAAMDRYDEMGVPGTEWLRAPDDRVCPTCAKNAAAGPVPLGEAYPSGHTFPPAHPRCRCVPAPVLLDMAKADAIAAGGGTFDESKHPRAAGGKFGPGGGGEDPHALGGPPAPPPVTVADLHNAAQQQTTVGGDTTDSDHPAAKLTAGAAAKARMADQMKQRNELMRQRLSQAQARQAAAELRRAQAQAKKDAAAAAAAKKKAAKGAKASALSDAASQAEQILRHLDALAAGKTDGELPELIKAEYPDLTAGQIALLIKAWDPALHPRDPLTGKFVSVGVRRPAFKPKTRKRWGRSKEEIQAWEWAHKHGEGTRFVDAGRAGARGVGHAPVGKFHQALDAENFHAVGQRNVQENMLVGRNRQELVVLADQLGMDGEALPRDLHNAKQRILDHEQRGRLANPVQRRRERAAGGDLAALRERDPEERLRFNPLEDREPAGGKLPNSAFPSPIHLPPGTSAQERRARWLELRADQLNANMVRPPQPKTDPVAHVYGELDKVAGDAEAMDRLIAPLDVKQHRALAVMVGHNAGGALDNPGDIRDEILRQKLYEHHQQRYLDQGLNPDVAQALARNKARNAVEKLRHPPVERPAGRVGRVRGEGFDTEHGALDAARGNRAAMANAIAHLKKADLIKLAGQRGHRIDGMGAKKDDLIRQFMFEEAFKQARADAVEGGAHPADAADHALKEARKVRDAARAEAQMAAELKVQQAARKAAAAAAKRREEAERAKQQAKDAAAGIKRAPRAAQVHIEPHGTGVTHDEEGYAIHHPAPGEMGGVFEGVVPGDAVPVRFHLGSGDAGAYIRDGQAELAQNLASGVKSRRAPDVQGAIGETAIITHNNGGKSVHKAMTDGWYDGVQQAHSEELGAHLALHMGINAPVVRQDPTNPRAVDMQFMDGYKAAAALHLSYEQEEQIRNSPQGRRVALLDVLVGNTDRHSGNWMLPANRGAIDFNNPDVVVIDHGFSFPITMKRVARGRDLTDETNLRQGLTGNTGSGVFSRNLGRGGDFIQNNYTHEEIDNARTALERMKPEFDRTGHLDWYNLAVARLGVVARNSSNQSVKAMVQGGLIHA